MKNITNIFFLVSAILLSNNAQAEKIGGLFDVDVKDKEIVIKSNMMTYYFARLVSPDGNTVSSPILIDRNDKKVKIDAGIKWEGAVPVPASYNPLDWLSFEQKTTTISSPSNSYSEWENSTLEFQGANLFDIPASWEKSKGGAVGLTLLNLSVIPQLVADSAGGKFVISTDSRNGIPKLLEFGEKLKNIQNSLAELNFYYTIIDVSLESIDVFMNEFSEDASLLEALTDARNYFKYVKTLMDNVGASVGGFEVDKTLKAEYKKTMLHEYLKDIEKNKEVYKEIYSKEKVDELRTKGIDATIKVLAEQFKSVEDDEAKKQRVIAQVLAGFQTALVSYQTNIVSKMPNKTIAEKKAIRDKVRNVQFAKLAVVVMAFTNSIMTDDIKNYPDWAMKLLTEVAGSVSELLLDNEINSVYSFISENAGNHAIAGEFRKGVAKIGKGFQIGHTLGNKAIPFLYDWFVENNIATANIIDEKISVIGNLNKHIQIYKRDGSDDTLIWDSNDDVGSPIGASAGDELVVRVDMQQDELFSEIRSPFLLNGTYYSRNLFSVDISANRGDASSLLKSCVLKHLFYDPKFVVYRNTYSGNSEINANPDCFGLEKIPYLPSISNFPIITVYEDDDLPGKYKLSTLEDPKSNKGLDFGLLFNVNDSFDPIQVVTSGLGSEWFETTTIRIIPPITNLDIEVKSDSEATKNLLVAFNAGSIQVPSVDPLISQSWDWGDGEVTDFPAGTQLGSVTHTYASQGYYTVTLTLTSESGLQTVITKEVEVLSAAEPFGISVEKLGYSAKIEWNAIQGVTEYSVCLSEDIIVDGVCLNEDYLTSTSDSEFTYHGLNGETTYHVGVSYLLDSGERKVSDNKTFSLEAKERDFDLREGDITSSSIELVWDKPDGATYYRACQSGFDIPYADTNNCENFIDGSWWEPIVGESMAISADIGGDPLLKDKDYHFRVVAVNDADEVIGVSNEVVVRLKKPDTFTVPANSETGTEFTVPDGAQSCTFSATGQWTLWNDSDPRQTYFDADGLATTSSSTLLPTSASGSLIVQRESGEYIFVGKKQVISVEPSEVIKFMINDTSATYSDNAGEQVVTWSCSTEIVDLDSGLVAHYKFEGNTEDSSVNGNHGTEYGDVTYVDGVAVDGELSKAVSFDGVDDYIQATSPFGYIERPELSVSFWLKPDLDKVSKRQWPIMINEPDYGKGVHFLINSSFDTQFGTYKDVHLNEATQNSFSIEEHNNKWVHFVTIYDRQNGVLKTYANGGLIDSDDLSTDKLQFSPSSILLGKTFNTSEEEGYSGLLDELRVYDRALNETEIQALYSLADLESENVSSLPMIFHDDFETSEPLSDRWDILTSPSCCGTGSPSNNQKVDGSLVLDVMGVSSGYSGVGDGSWIQTKDVILTGDFYIETELQELSRERNNGYKDNSGAGIVVTKNGSKDTVASINIAGNYSGYYTGYSYNQYNAHRIEATNHLPLKELELDELYKVAFRIQRDNGVITTGYKLEGSTSWVDTEAIVTNNEDLVVSIYIFSGDGGSTQQNGNLSVAVDYLTVKAESSDTSVDLQNGLVAYYGFEDNLIDSTANNNIGTKTTNVNFSDGKHGRAVSFGGVSSPGHIKINNSSSLQFSDGATYSGWLKIDQMVAMDGWGRTTTSYGGGTFFAKSHDRSGAGFKYHLNEQNEGSASTSTFDSWKGGWDDANYVFSSSLNNWVYVTYTFSSTAGTKIYFNGELWRVSSNPVNFTQMNGQDLYLGKFSDSWYPLAGMIDDFSIYNRLLSQQEILDLFEVDGQPIQ